MRLVRYLEARPWPEAGSAISCRRAILVRQDVGVEIEHVLRTSRELNRATESLAALGAYLRMRSEGIEVDPVLAAELGNVVEAMGINAASDLSAEDSAIVLGFIRAFFTQASSLLDDPGQLAGWTSTDPDLLQNQGRASAMIAHLVSAAAAAPDGIPGLRDRLAHEGSQICDIGTGVGWLAITFAQLFPQCHVTGIDIWEPALAIAEENVRDSGLESRVTLAKQDASTLTSDTGFDLTFVPGPFLPRDIVPTVLNRVRAATRAGGWAVLGLYELNATDELARALTSIRVLRSGGYPWTTAEGESLLRTAGFSDIRTLSHTWNAPMDFVVGRAE